MTSLTGESLGRVLAAKADAAWHLHEATEHLDLRMFVLFSSLAGLLGNAGQGNYAAANTYLDALAAHRTALGLPAVSIAWGLWEQASGMTGTLTEVDRARLARGGGVLLRTGQALGLLDQALSAGRPVVAAGLDVSAVRSAIASGTPVPAVLLGLGRPPRRAVAAARGLYQRAGPSPGWAWARPSGRLSCWIWCASMPPWCSATVTASGVDVRPTGRSGISASTR